MSTIIPARKNLTTAAILAFLITGLAAWLRFYLLGAQSLWYDEGNSAAMVGRSISQIIAAASGDIHPPLYYLLLAGWGAIAGKSEFALRFLSAIFGILTIPVMFALGKKLFDRRVAILAALLAAINPFQVYYGQEARMYMLVTLLGAASLLLTAHVLTIPGEMAAGKFRPRRAAAIIGGYILVNTAGLYTHYIFPAVLAAETLIFLIWLLRRTQKFHGLVTWVIVQAAALLLFLPWLPTALHQFSQWPRLTSGGVGFLDVLDTLAYGITTPAESALNGIGLMVLLALVGLLPPIDRRKNRRYLHFTERVGLVAAWLLIALILPAAQGAIREPTLKFLLPANIALMLLAARGFWLGWDIGREGPAVAGESSLVVRLVVLAMTLFAVTPLINGLMSLYNDPTYARDNYRAIAARIRTEAGDSAPVILDAPNQREVFTYYFPDGPNITPLPDSTTSDTIARLLSSNERIYAVFWGQAEQDPEGLVETALQAGAYQVDATWYGKVRLVTYAVAGPPAERIDTPSGARFSDSIVLDGFTLSADSLTPGEVLGVTLFWHTEAAIPVGYKVFVHIYNPDGTLLAQHDGEPAGGLRPTHQWPLGEQITDAHGLLIPPGTPPGEYQIMVGLYDGSNTRLAITLDNKSQGDRLLLTPVTIH